MFFTEKKIVNDDNDDDDVDDDVDYEEITAPLIHNLSIVFLSKLRTIEMYIKNKRTFKNYLGQYLLRDSPYQRNRIMLDFSFARTVYVIFKKNKIILPILQYSRGKFASVQKSPRCPINTLAMTGYLIITYVLLTKPKVKITGF